MKEETLTRPHLKKSQKINVFSHLQKKKLIRRRKLIFAKKTRPRQFFTTNHSFPPDISNLMKHAFRNYLCDLPYLLEKKISTSESKCTTSKIPTKSKSKALFSSSFIETRKKFNELFENFRLVRYLVKTTCVGKFSSNFNTQMHTLYVVFFFS